MNLADGTTMPRHSGARQTARRRCGEQEQLGHPGARVALTIAVVVLLAVVLAVVIAPWAPERVEAAAELFSSTAAEPGGSDAHPTAIPQRETGSGAHLAGSPVSIMPARAAAPTG